MIREAIAATRYEAIRLGWGLPPVLGLVTFVDAAKVRHKRDPGRCYRKAGFVHGAEDFTEGGLWAFLLAVEAMPDPEPPLSRQLAFAIE